MTHKVPLSLRGEGWGEGNPAEIPPFGSDSGATSPHPGPLPEGEGDSIGEELGRRILARVVGLDLNPLAVTTARANCLLATADLFPADAAIAPPIFLADAILDDVAEQGRFEFVVGNPPWIAWDNLPEPYRRATRPLWERYGLFSLSASAARHGGGEKGPLDARALPPPPTAS